MPTLEASTWHIFDGAVPPEHLLLLSCFGVLRAEGELDGIRGAQGLEGSGVCGGGEGRGRVEGRVAFEEG